MTTSEETLRTVAQAVGSWPVAYWLDKHNLLRQEVTEEWGWRFESGLTYWANDEEHARHEARYPTSPDEVNPVVIRRCVTDWEEVPDDE